MKRNKISITLAILSILALAITSCLQKIDIPDSNKATVQLNTTGPKFVTGDITVNPKDSIFFDFSITSSTDMKYVGIQKNPSDLSTFVVKDTLTVAQKNSFSAIKKLAADSANGVYTYRIVALDAAGIYVGSKQIVVTVNSDFNYYTLRVMQVLDTTAKTNTCYFASTTGDVFSYSNGAANSAKIDFGFYYDTTTANKFTVYALSAAQPQLSYYDISSWTKNVTIMKKVTTPTFASLTSAGSLRSAAVTNLSSGTTASVNALVAGNLVFFKTAAGKAGCLQVNFINGSNGAKTSFMNVDVKIEK